MLNSTDEREQSDGLLQEILISVEITSTVSIHDVVITAGDF